MRRRRETPLKRVNPSGEVVWVARCTDENGKRKSAGTFELKREAQDAIDAAYEAMEERQAGPVGSADSMTFGEYAEIWPERHPRPRSTADSHATRLNALLRIPVYGRPLAEYPYRELRRHHMITAFDYMLRVEGRAQKGAIGLRNTASAMSEDAITDMVAEVNFAKGAQVRANDPRVQKAARKPTIYSFDQLREFAAAARAAVRKVTPKPERHKQTGELLFYSAINYEPMVATVCLSNLRIGEVFALLQTEMDLDALEFHPSGNAYEGEIARGDSTTKQHEGVAPIAPSLATILGALPPRIDTSLLFPTPRGACWHYSNFIKDVWEPAQIASGLPILPHDCRHSYVTHMRRAGVDPADLADATRHTIQTATLHYTHPTRQSYDQMRSVIG